MRTRLAAISGVLSVIFALSPGWNAHGQQALETASVAGETHGSVRMLLEVADLFIAGEIALQNEEWDSATAPPRENLAGATAVS